ncbi:carbohydrate ABC transporter permease [Microbacterium sp.]|uniref:carbohydrate ABC transporter permease n=1 Tax=Microbacterium sp. TaxID=51671 RepID=UPI003A88B18E
MASLTTPTAEGTPVRRSLGGKPPAARGRQASRAEAVAGWAFLLPFLTIFLLFIAIPAVFALSTSFTDMTSRDIRNPFAVDFVGFDTFATVLSNPSFHRAIGNTIGFVLLCVPLSIVCGLALALMLDRGIRRLRTFFRAAVYVPVITNIVAAAVIWQYAFSLTGPVNATLEDLGLAGPNWLGDPGWAFTTVVMMGIWRNVGTCMVLFLAGLQAVPEEVYEAAATDGSGRIRTLWSITLPLLRPTTLLVSVLMTVSFLNIFEEPYLLTRGGPLSATESTALWVYDQFAFGNVSSSMAASVILLVFVAIVAIMQFRLLRPKH